MDAARPLRHRRHTGKDKSRVQAAQLGPGSVNDMGAERIVNVAALELGGNLWSMESLTMAYSNMDILWIY